jgi:type IV pilus assembly protein PilN
MIRINLLPHREAKRKLKQSAFYAMLALGAVIGVAVVLAVGGYNARRLSIQEQRNQMLKNANADLDKKIGQIATLRQEIEALKARQQAVEDLQGDRNMPVHLLDEMVRQVPDGVYLKSFKQDGQRVQLGGFAQSQERVAELLRNLNRNSEWLEHPDLGEIKDAVLPGSRSGKHVVEFTMAVGVKRPRTAEDDKGRKPGANGGAAAAAAKK